MLKLITTYFKFKYLLYLFAFIAGWPCVFYLMNWLPHYTVNYVILFVFAVAAALIKNAYKRLPKAILAIFLVQIFFWSCFSLYHGDETYFTRIFLLIITLSILAIQLTYRDKFEFIKTYNFWLTFQAFSGSIGFILVVFGFLSPLKQFIEMDGRAGYFYGLFTTNAVFGSYARNAGFYDEPGALRVLGCFCFTP